MRGHQLQHIQRPRIVSMPESVGIFLFFVYLKMCANLFYLFNSGEPRSSKLQCPGSLLTSRNQHIWFSESGRRWRFAGIVSRATTLDTITDTVSGQSLQGRLDTACTRFPSRHFRKTSEFYCFVPIENKQPICLFYKNV